MANDGTAKRQELLLSVYAQMGPERTLERLAQQLTAAGWRVSLSTLKRYSTTYHWQQRLLMVDAEAAAHHHMRAVETMSVRAERHAQLGRVFQSLAARAAEALLRDPESLSRSSPAAIARAGAVGTDIERRALGEEHNRQDIAVAIWSRITLQLVPAFLELNDLSAADLRVERFVRLIDELVDDHLRELAEGAGK